MSRILFTWEQGGGAGHVLPYRPVIESLLHRGHQIVFAARLPERAASLLEGLPVQIVPVPASRIDAADHLMHPRTYAEVLLNVGFGDPRRLLVTCRQWRWLFQQIKPDVIVHDHSPSGILASRGTSARRIHIGTGFTCPPNVERMPDLRSWTRPESGRRSSTIENQVVRNANWVMKQLGQAPVKSLAGLFHEIDRTVLATFPELDHAGPRSEADYWGVWNTGGSKPRWPAGRGRRVFAYLNRGPFLPLLLRELARRRTPSLVVCPGVPDRVRSEFTTSTLRMLDRPLDLAKVAEEADLAICHANHGTVATMLCQGVPTLLMPLVLEQGVLARRVAERNLGVVASVHQPESFGPALDAAALPAISRAVARFSHRRKVPVGGAGADRLVVEIEAGNESCPLSAANLEPEVEGWHAAPTGQLATGATAWLPPGRGDRADDSTG